MFQYISHCTRVRLWCFEPIRSFFLRLCMFFTLLGLFHVCRWLEKARHCHETSSCSCTDDRTCSQASDDIQLIWIVESYCIFCWGLMIRSLIEHSMKHFECQIRETSPERSDIFVVCQKNWRMWEYSSCGVWEIACFRSITI